MKSVDYEIEIPTPESDDVREVFTFVGLALYAAAVLEAELINFAVGLRASLKAKRLYREELESWFVMHETKTFGALATAVRKLTSLPQETEELLARALRARNRVVHSFFRDHAESFISAAGRRDMLEELRQDIILFRDADRALTVISTPLWPAVGVAEGFFDAELAAMTARAASRDEV